MRRTMREVTTRAGDAGRIAAPERLCGAALAIDAEQYFYPEALSVVERRHSDEPSRRLDGRFVRLELLPAADTKIRVSVASEGDGPRWDRFVATHPARTAYHVFGFRSLIEQTFGYDTYYLKAETNARGLVGVLPLVHVRRFLLDDLLVSLPFVNYGGPLAADGWVEQKLLAAATELAAKLGVAQLELRAQKTYGRAFHGRDDKVTMWLDLPPTADQLWCSFRSKLRAQIRRPEREAAVVATGGGERLADFQKVLSRNMRDLGTPFHSKKLFTGLVTLLGDRVRIVTVRLGGTPAAAAFLINHGPRVEVPWASSVRSLNYTGVNMLLYWALLEQSIEWGAPVFDFGRSTIGSGPYRFKQQWGARTVPLKYQYWTRSGHAPEILAPSNPRFALAIKLWKCIPLFASRLVGPPIVKYFP